MTMYIRDLACISPQPTHDGSFLRGELNTFEGNIYEAIEPDYAEVIPRNQLRRIGRSVRMGLWTGKKLLEAHPNPDGILIGTGEGAAEDFIRFMEQIMEYEEGTLTPTHFVQSTPNALAGSLALIDRNTGYNATYTDKGTAFESALLDALLLTEEGTASSLLVGTMEQYSPYIYNIEGRNAFFKTTPVPSDQLLTSGTPGTVFGEGSAMFLMSNDPEKAYARVKDVDQMLFPEEKAFQERVLTFLSRNGLEKEDIDALVLGWNGDSRNDHWYTNLRGSLFPQQGAYSFKNLVGDHPSSGAFATWLGAHLLNGADLPRSCVQHAPERPLKNVLIYNHYKGRNHGLVLLSKYP